MENFLESGGWILFVFAFFALLSISYRLFDIWRKAKKYDKLDESKRRLENLDAYSKQLEAYKAQLEDYFKTQQEIIEFLAKEKAAGFPWLAKAYAEYFHLQDLKKAEQLETKAHPAPKAAEQVRQVASQRRIAEQLHRILRYQLEYYENLFPWLVDFKGDDLDELIKQIMEKREKGTEVLEEPDDAAKKWLTEAEYEKLLQVEKYQLALDRYWQKKKSKWEIGRDYERYIGYLYEQAGFSVYYQGIIEGFEDLGRDLIAVRGDDIEIVQCKHWSKERIIHEKHVFQLFGTTIEYWLKTTADKKAVQLSLFPDVLQKHKIKPVLITSTTLSEKAKEFARVLQVEVAENFSLQHYPSIKCNVSRQTDEKIYHLPFDQQYDRTLVEEERNECYVKTVAEAEQLGFRRAFRWRGETSA